MCCAGYSSMGHSYLKPVPATIVDIVQETPSVRTLYISAPDLPEPLPGQFNMIYVMGLGEAPFSVSDTRRSGRDVIVAHTIAGVGAVTKYLVAFTKIGARVGLRGPYGRGWPLEAMRGSDVLIIGGGIGLAPLRPLIKYAEARKRPYSRLFILYGAKTPEDLLFKYELADYARIPNAIVKISVEKPNRGWGGHVGLVTDLIDQVGFDPANAVAYICGPEAMMKAAVRKLLDKGVRGDRIFLSLERRMRCGMGVCGTCQFGHYFVCKDGPVFSYDELESYLWVDGI